jgi:hypothetical protein
LKKREFNRLQKNFRSYIQPFLSGEDLEDYDLIWGWEKFLYDKSQKILKSEGIKSGGPGAKSSWSAPRAGR